MKVIQPNCRIQFTAEDIDFILSVLRPKIGGPDALVKLLTDEESRDLILDNEELLRAVLEHRSCLRISTHFYFYILVRQVFRRSGIMERAVADYVAEVLTEFSRIERSQCRHKEQPQPLDYFFEMLSALQTVDDTTRFYIRAHIGNYSLFISGIFHENTQRRSLRGAPDIEFYEQVGRSNYQLVASHETARRCELTDVFAGLASRFHDVRLALNELSDRLLHLDEDARPSLVL